MRLINNIIFANRNSSSLDSLSSGRISQIKFAWYYFSNNPFWGVGKFKTTDCFYISALVNFGIFAYPLIVMAVYPFIWSIYNYKLYKENTIYICFIFISVSMTIISFVEELAPFGPGVRCYILWLCWGVFLSLK